MLSLFATEAVIAVQTMASEKKIKLEATKADQADACWTGIRTLTNVNCFQRLSASVTRHAFFFLTVNELVRSAFQICKAFRSARAKIRSCTRVSK